MKIFLSYALKDIGLASRLARQLKGRGVTVWGPDEQIAAEDNWAKEIGRALDDSDLMVILLTPGAMQSDVVRQNIEFAIGSQQYQDRLFTVFVGRKAQAAHHVPWILLTLPHRVVPSADGFAQVAKDVRALGSAALSRSNA